MKETRFLVDAMLGSLARKLRIFGFDTEYEPSSIDDELIFKTQKDQRILITSDRELQRRSLKHKEKSILITSSDDEENLASIFRVLGLKVEGLSPLLSRCAVCNGLLERMVNERKVVVSDGIASQKPVFSCSNCQKRYWEGSHWKKLQRTAENIILRLEDDKTLTH